MKLIIDYDTLRELAHDCQTGDSLVLSKKVVDFDDIIDISEKIIECDECDYKSPFLSDFCVKNGLHRCPECGYCGEGKRERG